MDTTPLASGAAVRHVLRFEGRAGEYFRIWIVNLALTILTLGIFSAWAKIRTKRYLYGNTYIGEHAFDYHASPWRILLGRVIALVLLLGYSITAAIAPKFVIAWIVVFLIAMPWLVKSSLRFNARNTSYRNIRFNFHGTYGGALKAFILWQILAFITLFTTLPLAHRARDYYNINNHSFGGKAFETVIPGGRIYLIYLLGVVIYIGGFLAIGLAIASAMGGISFIPGSHHLPSINPAAIPAVAIAM
ncbi:MAG TPA: YjgN family protein, partial [Rhizomicrobium sp.]